MVKVSIVQMKSSMDKEENLQYSLEQIKESAKNSAKIICFPEFQMSFSPSSQSSEELFSLSESKHGNFVSQLKKSARDNNIFIVGSIYERANSKQTKKIQSQRNFDKDSYRVFDTVVLINNKGRLVSQYRKLHLYDALGFRESNKLLAGNKLFSPVASPLGKIGTLVCYDLRFPELSRMLALKGSGILIAPSGWVQGTMKEDHWVIMCKARAIENGVYLIAPNQIGNIFCGRSLIVDPFGIVVTDMGNKEGFDIVDLDLDRIDVVRKTLPLLKNRRKDMYKII
ncbi:MAG: carbon-nitrogen hydrolase family protein [Candidatus Nitrosocosmicus sp.]|jgi:predicted amidohydrolase|uniref:carbon-nitrogen hydrolase family protein n=1 Tax=Candidatus Nitrosocosmicus sp. FF01 TaxID=3397670 RepID=UPI002A6C4E6F|nr:amidohydrolase [Candidatus Nitrosocosmicus sp.]